MLCLAASCAANPGPPPLVEPEDRPDAVSERDNADADDTDADEADEPGTGQEPANSRPQAQIGIGRGSDHPRLNQRERPSGCPVDHTHAAAGQPRVDPQHTHQISLSSAEQMFGY